MADSGEDEGVWAVDEAVEVVEVEASRLDGYHLAMVHWCRMW